MLSKFLAYLNLFEFSLTVRDLIEGKGVLVVMARASSIKYSFAPEDYELDGQVTILVIIPLIIIIEDQTSEI